MPVSSGMSLEDKFILYDSQNWDSVYNGTLIPSRDYLNNYTICDGYRYELGPDSTKRWYFYLACSSNFTKCCRSERYDYVKCCNGRS
nr:expressed protein [Hymenolepis microstoma]